jgi:putative membrane protein
MLGAGLLLGFFLSLCKYWHIKTENRHIRNQLKMTEKEIKNLRAIPLKDQH